MSPRILLLPLLISILCSGCQTKKGKPTDRHQLPEVVDRLPGSSGFDSDTIRDLGTYSEDQSREGGTSSAWRKDAGPRLANGETVPEEQIIRFNRDGAELDSEAMLRIEALAQRWDPQAPMQILLFGHCDERGSADYNLALGERRAQTVGEAFVQQGIDPNWIQTLSYGEEMPADPGHHESAWRQNRRVEITFLSL